MAIDAMKAQGVPVVHLRLVVEDECKKRGLPLDNKNLRSVASDLRVTYGRDVVVKRASGLIDAAYNNGHMVIDSLKSPEELVYLRGRGYDVLLVALHASPSKRFERIKERGLPWDPKKREEFDWRDKTELTWGLGDLIALADVMVVNEGSIELVASKVVSLLPPAKKKV